jgi:hypothetical protein
MKRPQRLRDGLSKKSPSSSKSLTSTAELFSRLLEGSASVGQQQTVVLLQAGRLTPPSRGRPQAGFAHLRPPLTSNVRLQVMRRQVALLLLQLALLSACSELGNGAGQISQKIGQVTHDPSTRELNLSKLTSFGWEYFYFFKSGTAREQICQLIHANRNNCGRIIRYEAVPEGYVALFFGLNGNLTHTELHALANGEFDFTVGEDGYPKEKAIFSIRRAYSGTGQDRILLEPR